MRFGVQVTGIAPLPDGGFRVDTAGSRMSPHPHPLPREEGITARNVIVALPAYGAAGCCAAFGSQLTAALEGIRYAGITVVSAGYRRDQVGHDLNGFGFLVPRTEGKRLLGCLWDSTLFPERAPEEHVLLRAMYGGYSDPEAVGLSDGELLEYLRREVHPLLRISGDPELLRIYRHPRGIPQYLLGHEARLRAVEAAETRFPGLIFAGNAYRGIGLNDCVLSALRAVARLEPPG